MRQPCSSPVRPRITLDVSHEFRRRLPVAAARRDMTLREHVLSAINARLSEDLEDPNEGDLGFIASADPVLVELWDNEADATYDRV